MIQKHKNKHYNMKNYNSFNENIDNLNIQQYEKLKEYIRDVIEKYDHLLYEYFNGITFYYDFSILEIRVNNSNFLEDHIDNIAKDLLAKDVTITDELYYNNIQLTYDKDVYNNLYEKIQKQKTIKKFKI